MQQTSRKNTGYKPILTIAIVLLFFPLQLFSQATFTSGNITLPSLEKYVLKGLNADKKEISYIFEYRIKKDPASGADTWEVVSSTMYPNQKTDQTITFRLPDVQVVSQSVLYTYAEGSYAGTYKLVNESNLQKEKNVFFFANSQLILYILRCFPFVSETKEIEIRSFGTKGTGFKMYAKNKGLKKLKLKNFKTPDGNTAADGYTCDAYELEFGIDMPLFSMLIPKTYYYFRNDPQKTLVKIRGALMPGEKETEIELAEYTIQN